MSFGQQKSGMRNVDISHTTLFCSKQINAFMNSDNCHVKTLHLSYDIDDKYRYTNLLRTIMIRS